MDEMPTVLPSERKENQRSPSGLILLRELVVILYNFMLLFRLPRRDIVLALPVMLISFASVIVGLPHSPLLSQFY
jgi:hypothetical protein